MTETLATTEKKLLDEIDIINRKSNMTMCDLEILFKAIDIIKDIHSIK